MWFARKFEAVEEKIMLQEIEQYLEKYPQEIVLLFLKIREVVFSIEENSIEEKMWAKLPSYYCGEKFVRIIPFKDHINIEAEGLSRHACEFEGCKYTTKGMLQIQVNQIINFDVLKTVFTDTYMKLN